MRDRRKVSGGGGGADEGIFEGDAAEQPLPSIFVRGVQRRRRRLYQDNVERPGGDEQEGQAGEEEAKGTEELLQRRVV